jgi:hypothetical protein
MWVPGFFPSLFVYICVYSCIFVVLAALFLKFLEIIILIFFNITQLVDKVNMCCPKG